MSFRRKPTDFEIEQAIFLGAKISDAHTEFKKWAMLDPDIAFLIWMLEHPNANFLDMLEANGKLEFLKATTEVTKLSMIVGTGTKTVDVKKEIDQLRSTQ